MSEKKVIIAVNKIGLEGAKALSETLKVNTTLTTLYLSGEEEKYGGSRKRES